jgi:hypothetical protein
MQSLMSDAIKQFSPHILAGNFPQQPDIGAVDLLNQTSTRVCASLTSDGDLSTSHTALKTIDQNIIEYLS